MVEGIEAVVLRTLRYGEADLIAHVLTRHAGRRGVIAKGARRPKSRLGARLEPFLAVSLQLIEGRGDLATVRSVELLAAHEAVRASWRAQQVGAAALDLVSRVTVEHHPVEPTYHLLRNFLARLDAADSELHSAVMLAAFELKLLHAIGIAPQLGACVRCGNEHAIVAFCAADGGVVCASCRTAMDQPIDAALHAGAMQLLCDSLAVIAARPSEELPAQRVLSAISSGIVAATCREHIGVTIPRLST